MQSCDLVLGINTENLSKCQICNEIKQPRKYFAFVSRESELLDLIHTGLDDLKQVMTRGGNKYYITFIDDCSRYTRVYLLKNKDEAFDKCFCINHKLNLGGKLKKV